LIVKGIAFLGGVSSMLVIDEVATTPLLMIVALILLAGRRYMPAYLCWLNPLALGLLWASVNVYAWGHYRTSSVQQPARATIQGTICSIPQAAFQGFQFDLCIDSVNGNRLKAGEFNRVKVNWSRYAPAPSIPLKAGQSWQLNAKVKPPHGRYNPAGGDYQRWMLTEGYLASASVKSAQQTSSVNNPQAVYLRLRQQLFDYLRALFPEGDQQALLLALTLGERGGISQHQWDTLRFSGTSHLLAISGLHIGVMALWSFWLVMLFWRRSERLCLWLPAQTAAEIGAMTGALFMLLLSGLGLPAQRAFLMLAIFLISRWSGRHYRLSSVLGIALIVILLLHPFAVLSASFWLSFLAVYVIMLVVQRQQSASPKITQWLKINWFLYLTMLPISLVFFDSLSVVALIANLVLIPLVSFVLIPLLYLGLLLLVFYERAAQFVFALGDSVIGAMFQFQMWLSGWNQTLADTRLPGEAVLLLSMLMGFLLLPRALLSRWLYLPAGMLFLLSMRPVETEKPFEMLVFDIGQGLAIYVQTPQGRLIYDTGWGNTEFAMAVSAIQPFLDQKNIITLDKLIVSHGDSDHAGGVTHLLDKLKVEQIISGEPLKLQALVTPEHTTLALTTPEQTTAAQNMPAQNMPALGPTVYSCHGYPAWQWGPVQFEFLEHLTPVTNGTKSNNASCVLSINTGQQRILLTGDIEKKAERKLLANGLASHQVVIAPHHGSNTSSSQAFLDKLRPQEVIFSSGYANQWRFPRPEVMTRYASVGAKSWVTHAQGAVRLSIPEPGSPLTIQTERAERAHFWLKAKP